MNLLMLYDVSHYPFLSLIFWLTDSQVILYFYTLCLYEPINYCWILGVPKFEFLDFKLAITLALTLSFVCFSPKNLNF